MNTQEMLRVIEGEISRLQRAADALRGTGSSKARTRPKLSADARARIAAAQRKRWAKVKAGKKAA